jgi:hypothetical protein
MGDRSLFTRPDGLEHVWKVADGILRDKPEPILYAKGSWGPPAKQRSWQRPTSGIWASEMVDAMPSDWCDQGSHVPASLQDSPDCLVLASTALRRNGRLFDGKN